MGIDVQVVGTDSSGGKRQITLTKSGELVTAPLSYDETKYNAMSSTGIAYNFATPLRGKQFILTGFLAVSDKNITADAIVEIYEANAIDSTVVQKELPTFAITKNAIVPANPLRILVNEGVWVNAKTDDATIHLTMFGYYINKI